MARIKIRDLPNRGRITAEELKQTTGGGTMLSNWSMNSLYDLGSLYLRTADPINELADSSGSVPKGSKPSLDELGEEGGITSGDLYFSN
jgi:hypothetical protein